MNKQRILEKAKIALEYKTDFEVTWQSIGHNGGTSNVFFSDGLLEIKIENTKVKFRAAIKNEVRLYQLAEVIELDDLNAPFICIAETISSTLKENLRELKIGYLDTAGNFYVNTPNLYVWIEGQKATDVKNDTYNRAFTKAGLKVIFYLLLEQDAINMPYRSIAEATGVSIGNIGNVLKGLEKAGFILKIDKKKMRLQSKDLLLKLWIFEYDQKLKPSLFLGIYRTQLNSWKDLKTQKGLDFWSEEPAAELITGYLEPAELVLYTNQSKGIELSKLRLVPDAIGGNFKLYKKFWNHNLSDQQWYAPPLLVYVDLVLTDDPRCIEAAKIIYKQYLKDEFDEPERTRTETIN